MPRARRSGLESAPPQGLDNTAGFWDDSQAGRPSGHSSEVGRGGRGHTGERTTANNKLHGFNIRGVAEVLASHGLDPTEAIVAALNEKKIVRRDGEEHLVHVLDAETRMKASLALLEYIQPKLKSVEVTNKGPELTDEQIDRRLEALLERSTKAKK